MREGGGGERRLVHSSDSVSENKVWRQGASTLGLIQLWFQVPMHLCSGHVVPDGMIVGGIWCNFFILKCLLLGQNLSWKHKAELNNVQGLGGKLGDR